MRRILILLDSSDLPASILPAAWKYTRPGDELVLACVLQPIDLLRVTDEVNGGGLDLQREVETLRKSGVLVRAELLPAHDLPAAVSRAGERFHPDMIAVAARSGAELASPRGREDHRLRHLSEGESPFYPMWRRVSGPYGRYRRPKRARTYATEMSPDS